MTRPAEASGPTARSQRFPGTLRLKQRRLLRPLFRRSEAASVAAGGIRLLYRRVPRAPQMPPLQVAFLPGKQPTSVVRNRVRRTLREVYRCHHARLVDLLPLGPAEMLTLGVLLRAAPTPDLYARVAHDLPRALDRLVAALGAPDASSHNPGGPTA